MVLEVRCQDPAALLVQRVMMVSLLAEWPEAVLGSACVSRYKAVTHHRASSQQPDPIQSLVKGPASKHQSFHPLLYHLRRLWGPRSLRDTQPYITAMAVAVPGLCL